MSAQLWAHGAGVDDELELRDVDGVSSGAVLELVGLRSYRADDGDRAGILVTRDELAELVRYCVAHGIVPTPTTRQSRQRRTPANGAECIVCGDEGHHVDHGPPVAGPTPAP